MPKTPELPLTIEERLALERLRDTGAKAYLRERAAAILKVADGMAIYQVANEGLLKRRRRQTVGEWVTRYRAAGIGGLSQQPGRGRPAAFFPQTRER